MIDDLQKFSNKFSKKDKEIIAEYEEAIRIFNELVEKGLAKRRETLLPLRESALSINDIYHDRATRR